MCLFCRAPLIRIKNIVCNFILFYSTLCIVKFMRRAILLSHKLQLLSQFSQLVQAANAKLMILPNHANIYRGAIAYQKTFLLPCSSPSKLIFTWWRNDAFFDCRATREQTLRDDYKYLSQFIQSVPESSDRIKLEMGSSSISYLKIRIKNPTIKLHFLRFSSNIHEK